MSLIDTILDDLKDQGTEEIKKLYTSIISKALGLAIKEVSGLVAELANIIEKKAKGIALTAEDINVLKAKRVQDVLLEKGISEEEIDAWLAQPTHPEPPPTTEIPESD